MADFEQRPPSSPPSTGMASLAIFSPLGASPGGGKLRSAMQKVRAVGAAVQATQEMKAAVKRRLPVRYKDYDHDGALPLDPEEFYSLMPRVVREKHSARAILRWYAECAKANGKHVDITPEGDGRSAESDGPRELGVSINEFFLWTLSPSASRFGAASLGAALIKYDTAPEFEAPGVRRNGNLDKGELSVACRDMGFGSRVEIEQIFKSLDKDLSGEVSYTEMVESVAAEGCGDISLDAKRMLLALAWTSEEDDDGLAGTAAAAAAAAAAAGPSQVELNLELKVLARGWRITGRDQMAEKEATDAEKHAKELASLYEAGMQSKELDEDAAAEARKQIKLASDRARELDRALGVANANKVRLELMDYKRRSGFMLADMVSLMLGLDDDMTEDRSDKGIDDVQFYSAMTRRFGYRGTPWVLSTVFRGIDADGDCEVCFDELWEWVRGRRHPLDVRIDRTTKRVRDVLVEAPFGAGFALDDLEWGEPVLRALIWRALEVAKVSTLDLVRVSCNAAKSPALDAHPAVNKTEFLRMVHRLLRGVDRGIWTSEIRPLAEALFPVVAGAHDNIGGILSKKIDVRELEKWLRASEDDTPTILVHPPLKRKASPSTLERL
jgi:Ca2+-binding EF-hand superfamily protein